LNRRALPSPEELLAQPEAAYVPPENDLEQTIAAVWQEAFNVERVSIHSNFFDLGGNSLMLAKVHSKLRAALHRDIRIVDLFQHSTIHSLAKYLDETEATPVIDAGREQADLRKKLMKRRRSTQRAAAGV
jgi:acyl carrier protein